MYIVCALCTNVQKDYDRGLAQRLDRGGRSLLEINFHWCQARLRLQYIEAEKN